MFIQVVEVPLTFFVAQLLLACISGEQLGLDSFCKTLILYFIDEYPLAVTLIDIDSILKMISETYYQSRNSKDQKIRCDDIILHLP